ncbi:MULTISPECIES: O-antigen ligase family protein [unclassified Fusobacterium]|nr:MULTISPECIES: O-antigen ligase family protein [unclassified Fusobacterium]
MIFLKQRTASKIFFSIFFYWGIILLSTIFNPEGDIFSVIIKLVMSLTIVLITEQGILNHKMEFLTAVTMLCNTLVIINLISVVIFPNGLYYTVQPDNWFLGNRNGFIFLYLLTIYCNFLKINLLGKGKLKIPKFIIAIIIISSYLVWSAASLLVVSFVCILMIFIEKKIIKKILDIFFVMGMYFFVSYLFVYLKIQYHFRFIIEGYLKRKVTLSKREYIWECGVEYIKKHFTFGVGIEKKAYIERILGYDHLHNQFLDMLYIGGVALIIIFIFIIYLINKNIKVNENLFITNMTRIVICGYFIEFLVESRKNSYYFYITLILAYYLNYIFKNGEESTYG